MKRGACRLAVLAYLCDNLRVRTFVHCAVRIAFICVPTAVTFAGQRSTLGRAGAAVARAYCDRAAAHVIYDDGHSLIRAAKRGETCSDMRVSDDRRVAAWVMSSEARATAGGRVVQRWTRERLFANGVEIQYEGALYNWRFRDGGRQLVFEAGPLHGGGNLFLYDVEKQRIIDTCIQRADGIVCPEWAK